MPGRLSANKGATLVEVLIASSLFLIVSAALLFTLRSSKSNLKPSDEQSQNLRACLISVDSLSQELFSAWVTEPLPGIRGPQLRYRVPLRDSAGAAVTGPTGDLQWSLPRTIDFQAGKMMRTEDTSLRIISTLGNSGSLEFHRVSSTLLEVTVKSSHGQGFELKRSYQLNNQF